MRISFPLVLAVLSFWGSFAAAEPLVAARLEAQGQLVWNNAAQTLEADKNVEVFYGPNYMRADLLHMDYERPAGQFTIRRIKAVGAVVFRDPRVHAAAVQAIYLPAAHRIDLLGAFSVEDPQMRVSSQKGELSYTQSYRDAAGVLQPPHIRGRGGLVFTSRSYRLATSEAEGFFEAAAGEDFQLTRVEARGQVSIFNGKERLMAQKATYYPLLERAVLTDRVTLEHEGSVLRGCRGEVDLKAQKSRLEGCAATNNRIHILLSGDSLGSQGAPEAAPAP